MPTITHEFEVKGTPAQVWAILNDPISLGSCIPGCEEVVELNSEESRWKIKINAGVISKRIDSKSRIIEREEPTRIVVKLDSLERDFSANFTLNLKPTNEATLISFVAEVNAKGPFQWIIDQVVNHQLKKMVAQFSDAISKKVASI